MTLYESNTNLNLNIYNNMLFSLWFVCLNQLGSMLAGGGGGEIMPPMNVCRKFTVCKLSLVCML